jgi:hypothetical protein
MTSITRITTRFNTTAYAVRWGAGLTQMAVVDTMAEAESMAAKGWAGRFPRNIQPLVVFDGHR